MDDRLQKALEHSNYQFTLNQQKENIRSRFANALLYAQNGGLFTVSPALIAFVETLSRLGHTDAVITDNKGNPIRIDVLADFLEDIVSTYVEATNEYYTEYEVIRKARSVKGAIKV